MYLPAKAFSRAFAHAIGVYVFRPFFEFLGSFFRCLESTLNGTFHIYFTSIIIRIDAKRMCISILLI